MKRHIYDLLKGKFLISEDAVKNWRFILFCALLAMVMIACSHSAERKVHQIAQLQKDVRMLRSEFVDQRQRMMKMKMESSLSRALEDKEIMVSSKPTKRIVVKEK